MNDEFIDENVNEEFGDDDDIGDTKKLSLYDEKEKLARLEIKKLFEELIDKIGEVKENLGGIVERETFMVARQYRVKLSFDEVKKLERMEDINKFFTTASIYLTDFFSFSKVVSPRFDLVINLIFTFQQALIKEQGRPFAKIKREKGKFYLSKALIDGYLKGIDIHLSRIMATLGSAGTYIAVAPVSARGAGYEGGGVEDGDENFEGEGSDYDDGVIHEGVNSNSWWKRDSEDGILDKGAKINPAKRDFGDRLG